MIPTKMSVTESCTRFRVRTSELVRNRLADLPKLQSFGAKLRRSTTTTMGIPSAPHLGLKLYRSIARSARGTSGPISGSLRPSRSRYLRQGACFWAATGAALQGSLAIAFVWKQMRRCEQRCEGLPWQAVDSTVCTRSGTALSPLRSSKLSLPTNGRFASSKAVM